MDRTTFMKELGSKLYPILRAEGFRGSGNTLRRIYGPIVHVFNVQGSSSTVSFYLNVGAHLLFLATPGGGKPEGKKINECQCAFRDRIDPPTGSGTAWNYGRNEMDMQETVAFICEHWKNYAHSFFDRYSRFPEDFESLIANVDVSSTHPIQLMTLARIAAHLSDYKRAGLLASEGLKRCPERATTLRTEFEQFIRSVM